MLAYLSVRRVLRLSRGESLRGYHELFFRLAIFRGFETLKCLELVQEGRM